MKVSVINLKNRKDRLDFVSGACKREGLEMSVHEATNGQVVYFNDFDTKRMRGHAGCHHSHVSLLQKLKGTAKYHIILEDDVDLISDFKQKVLNLTSKLPNDWNMLYIGGNLNVYKNPIEPFNEFFNIAKQVLATHAYIVNDSKIDEILSVINSRVYKIDIMFIEYQKNNQVFISKECLAWQGETFSDIVFTTIDSNTRY
jgi:GR25 family glycosyltransferase involved in LPS biosynthesis